ncbi:MAG: PolC-type DNA polymerase III [Lachnospiraceae bacterium]|nr:PolC-type DNA polymerase III [Lachnospiraceae bacterium]
MGVTKSFEEVFPTLELSGELKAIFHSVAVRKVRTTASRNFFHVYIESPYLIQKSVIGKTERLLEKELFPHAQVKFRLHETFRLSRQYDSQTLIEEYGDSISEELKQESPILNHLYRHADFQFDDKERVTLTVEDTIVAREEADHLADYLTNIVNVRCGLKADIRVDFKAEERPEAVKEAERRVQKEIARLTRAARMSAGGDMAPESGQNTADKADAPGDSKGAAGESRSEEAVQAQKTTNSSGGDGGRFNKGKGLQSRRKLHENKKPKNPNVIRGYDFEGDVTPLNEILGDIGEVIVRGQLFRYEEKQLRNEKTVINMDLTDFTDSIGLKLFLKNEEVPEFREAVGAKGLEKGGFGIFCMVKGSATYDNFEHDVVISGIRAMKKIGSFMLPRVDDAPEKRVELHCHTKLSELDGVSDVKDILKRADDWGWNALAITDHGSVQAFPDANHFKQDKMKNKDFKVIYGCEGYLVDDETRTVWQTGRGDGRKVHSFSDPYVVFDIETTGFSPVKNRIIEIGAVRIENGVITDRFDEFINPEVPIPFEIVNLTGIQDHMVCDKETVDKVLPRFLSFVGDAILVAHNARFDVGFIRKNAADLGLPFEKQVLDTLPLARHLLPELSKFTLDKVATELGVSLENHHRAVDDAEATAGIFLGLLDRLRDMNMDKLEDLSEFDTFSDSVLKRLPRYHIILLAKNETGRVNLYRLVSESHTRYYQQRPRIPRSLLKKCREGIIIGSACEAGELYQALVNDADDEDISQIVQFYDYLEIQPLGNNRFLIEKEKNSIDSEEDLMDINRRIVKLGEQFRKPVCATCDVHFLDPADEVYRRIMMGSKGFKDGDEQPPLYLRTTDEMVEEFLYLGEKKAREVVITNTNLIADMIEYIVPVRPDKCPPVIENSDNMLREICYDKAHEMYGEKLPEILEKRLETELNSIIGNGYAVMYVIAQKLVWKSNEDGYLVGSRGSVGSSLAAYFSGITEVNSLPCHYRCPSCHYYDFDSPEVKSYANKNMCGCDMPDRVCPVCGKPLIKDGFDIPFETFLGFSGDKEPDIDLNFSGDYQSKAHKYTEVIFGNGQTFRAGTIGTMAEKTAYGYVLKYLEERGMSRRRAEKERLAKGLVGVLRTTGQHPGGIVVLPRGENMYSFTPLQHPANDMTTSTITTHFDFHSIDHNLLKLDILGHDDPTMIRFLQDATGVDPLKIPLDEEKVMSLFSGPEALGISPEDIDGCPTGTLGVPEFGTDFVIQMLVDTKPKTFTDLIRISGLSHGTDVWTGNAQYLVNEMGMQLADCICCRDDIMLYLINKGMDPSLSFKTMEAVRKGKGLKPEMQEAMTESQVPDWYIDSCKKIKYMFPKAHAAAYVMMAWRVAWFKVYRPAAYYSAFFSIRSNGIDYATMCQGRGRLEVELKKLLGRLKEVGKNEMTATELDTIRDMRIVQEMYARGLEFVPIDLNQVDPRYFREVDEKHIMPALSSLEGMGGKDADELVNSIGKAREGGDFLSVDDFVLRTSCSKNKAMKLKEMGLLGDIPDSNQLSLFDMMGNG